MGLCYGYLLPCNFAARESGGKRRPSGGRTRERYGKTIGDNGCFGRRDGGGGRCRRHTRASRGRAWERCGKMTGDKGGSGRRVVRGGKLKESGGRA